MILLIDNYAVSYTHLDVYKRQVYLFAVQTDQIQSIMFGGKGLGNLESSHIRTVHFFFLLFIII